MLPNLDEDQVTEGFYLGIIGIEDPAITEENAEAMVNAPAVVARLSGSILLVIAGFLRDNAEFLPSKKTVIAAANKAIDAALDQIGRPWLAALIGPAVKGTISRAVEALYDAIVPPTTTV